MVLMCLTSTSGHYRIEDDDGHILAGPFFSTPDPAAFARQLAESRREQVTVRLADALGGRTLFVVAPPPRADPRAT